ncbi:hypothetical protein [uncultured Sulfitobacter sp.]|uniref:hypothetical protein n=1 Tax=uncultured Sulfitobacter sp. TaxID=191468 RepID=UPI00260D6328|nr:hypothetical protein [uncultured Sulfitobacter sp.]
MRRLLICGAIALLGAGPLAAQSFKAQNGVTVVPVAGGFLVQGDAGVGARGMWCAAADYARRVEGARAPQRLYVAEGRKGRGGVTFTLDANGQTRTPVTIVGLTVRDAGANMGVGHAIGFCADHKLLRSGNRP